MCFKSADVYVNIISVLDDNPHGLNYEELKNTVPHESESQFKRQLAHICGEQPDKKSHYQAARPRAFLIENRYYSNKHAGEKMLPVLALELRQTQTRIGRLEGYIKTLKEYNSPSPLSFEEKLPYLRSFIERIR